MGAADSRVTLVTLDVDARLATVATDLTVDGSKAALSARGVAAPVFYFDDSRRQRHLVDVRPYPVPKS